MARLALLALVALASCGLVHPLEREEPRELVTCPPIPPPPPPVVIREPACRLTPPPELPPIVWVAKGCPPKFLTCLNGPDTAAFQAWLKATQAWQDGAMRCTRVGR